MPERDTEPLLVDFLEAARRLGVGRTTIYALVNAGQLRTVKIGRRSLIVAASLREYVARLAGEPVAS